MKKTFTLIMLMLCICLSVYADDNFVQTESDKNDSICACNNQPFTDKNGIVTGFAITPTYEDSVIEYTQEGATAENYNIKIKKEGTDEYYLINILDNKMSTSESIDWEKSGSAEAATIWDATANTATGTIKITLPYIEGSSNSYYTYTYTTPSSYTIVSSNSVTKSATSQGSGSLRNYYYNGGGVMSNTASNFSITDKVYANNTLYTNIGYRYNIVGGNVLLNKGTITNINADFINNTTTCSSSAPGTEMISAGVILNTGTINEINGNFIGNKMNSAYGIRGTVIFNNGTIGSIKGDFIDNKATSTTTRSYEPADGAIYNIGNITSIEGNFISNSVSNRSCGSQGGAIDLDGGTINNITGNFISNYTYSSNSSAVGGAIRIIGTTNFITGDFIGNYSCAANYYTNGGAIYSVGSNTTINSIQGTFIGNYVKSTNSGGAHGGAICNNVSTIENINNSSFFDNYVITDKSSVVAQGGAIYTNTGLTFNSTDGYESVFSGNYVQKGSGATKQYEGIYVDSTTAVLTLNATTGGKFIINDYINGAAGYSVNITGDGTGTLYLYNDIINGNVNVENTTVSTQNDAIKTYEFYSLSNGNNANIKIDIDLTGNGTSDKFKSSATSNTAVKTFILQDINLINFVATEKDYVIQVLDVPNANVQLTLGEGLNLDSENAFVISSSSTTTQDVVLPTVNWNDEFNKTVIATDTKGYVTLENTKTVNDSVGLSVKNFESTVTESLGDTLNLLNTLETTETRNFNFDTADDEYILTSTLGETSAGTLNINGKSAEQVQDDVTITKTSVIDLNNKGGFNLTNVSTMNINNVTINGEETPITVTNSAASVSINTNSIINGNVVNSGIVTNSGTISGAFTNNINATLNNYGVISGVVTNKWRVNNSGSITNLNADVYNYSRSASDQQMGGVVSNDGTIQNIEGDFISNSVVSTNRDAFGGAINNFNMIGTIKGYFEGNVTEGNFDLANSVGAEGGAISNVGSNAIITKIEADFVNNHSENKTGASGTTGGALANRSGAKITNGIEGNFTGNWAKSNQKGVQGGAIYNHDSSTIGNISSNFSNNYAQSISGFAYGGAIYNDNSSTIEDITGNFNNNYVISESKITRGGAIYNYSDGSIGNIEGKFNGNYAESENNDSYGGAIYNRNSMITNITADFSNNYVQSTSSLAYGGAIYNDNSSTIEDITGNFNNNRAISISNQSVGGAIYNANSSTIGDITGNFSNNYSQGESSIMGGAIFNYTSSTIRSISGDFNNNYAKSGSNTANGGAIYNRDASTIGCIIGNFSGNYAQTTSAVANGGAIYNYNSNIGAITGKFTNNYTYSSTANSFSGAIHNLGTSAKISTIKSIYAEAIGNYSIGGGNANGGFSNNNAYTFVTNGIKGIFTGNYTQGIGVNSYTRGGAIINYGEIAKGTADYAIEGIFTNNYTITLGTASLGGALANMYGSSKQGIISSVFGTFTGNYVLATGNGYAQGGSIYNQVNTTLPYISGDFIGNYALANGTGVGQGGAICNESTNLMIVVDSSFKNNLATTAGGAIYNSGTITIFADTKDVEFSGNKIGATGIVEVVTTDLGDFERMTGVNTDNTVANDVHNTGTFIIKANNGRVVTFNGSITTSLDENNAPTAGTININTPIPATAESEGVNYIGTVNFNDKVSAQNLNLNGGTIHLGANNIVNTANFTVNNGILDTVTGAVETQILGNVNLVNNLENHIDINLANTGSSDLFKITNVSNESLKTFTIEQINWLNLPDEDAEYLIQVLQTPDDKVQLALGEGLNIDENNHIVFSTSSTEVISEITPTVKWDYKCQTVTITNTVLGTITLAMTDTTNDSIAFTIENIETTETVSLGDTLALWNTMNTDENRNFNFDTANDEYPLTTPLGETTAGVLNLNGYKSEDKISTIDLNGNGGFNLTQESTMNINDVRIKGAEPAITVTHNNAVVNISKNSVIEGGVTNSGTVNNKGAITGNIENKSGGYMNNSGTITGNTDNYGIVLNSGTITGAFDNKVGASLNNTGYITGAFTNNGDLVNDGIISGLTTNGEGHTILNNDEITNNLINQGIIENTGVISGDIANQGTVNSPLKNLTGGVANEDNAVVNYYGAGSTNNNISGSGKVAFNPGEKAVVVNNDMGNNTVAINEGTLVFGSNKSVAGFEGNGGSINSITGKNETIELGKVTLNEKTNLVIDVNIGSKKTDKFIADEITGEGKFNVSGVNISGSTLKDKIRIVLGKSTTLGEENVTSDKVKLKPIITPIKKLEGKMENGVITYSAPGNSYKSYNPASVIAPVAAQLGGYFVQLHSYEEAFNNLDMKMLMNQDERKAMKFNNKYALADDAEYKSIIKKEVTINLSSNSNKLGLANGNETPIVYSPLNLRQLYQPEQEKALWFRPYATFERVNMKNGPKVSNILYGSYFGGESPMYELKHGWDFQYSAYVGYNGSHQAYQGNDIYQNGGTFGVTGMWFKGNFFTALTANVGAGVAEGSTMYGSEDFPMLMSGIASKTGYNFEFSKGRFIIQPNYIMSYSFVHTFNYTNAAGVRVTSDPLHAINIAPGLKIIGNLKNGWQPYVSLRMVWNIMDKTDFRAADIALPDMSIKPYFEYGIGLQKRWCDRFTGFVQAMMRSGGRNGIALGLGLRWAIGR